MAFILNKDMQEQEYPTATLTFLEDNTIVTSHPVTHIQSTRRVTKNEEEKKAIVLSHIGSIVKLILYPRVIITTQGNSTSCQVFVGNYFECNLLDRQPLEPHNLLFKLVYDPKAS